jgi:hypothetical protein
MLGDDTGHATDEGHVDPVNQPRYPAF